MLETKDNAVTKLVLPSSLILSALASEIYLKCLHYVDRGESPGGHSLADLFLALPVLRQRRIEAAWDKMTLENAVLLDERDKRTKRPFPRDLASALRDGDLGFIQLRYAYENPNFTFYIAELPTVLRNTILSIHPTWKVEHPPVTTGLQE